MTVATVGEETRAGRAGLDAARATLERAGREVEATLLPGSPEEALGRLVQERGPGLVVMGAYGHSRIRSLVIGSTTTEMIRSCKAPIVLVR